MRRSIDLLTWGGVPLGIGLLALGWLAAGAPRWALVILGCFLLVLGLLLDYWHLRPNRAHIDKALVSETWQVVNNQEHNSNTDMIFWRGNFYLVHAASPYHFASRKCRLILWRSADARRWEKLAEFASPDEDIRDPKLAPISGRLFLYALVNRSFDPEPYTTVAASSPDGETWSAFERIQPEGWLFWRPKSRDGSAWYVPAYWWQHGTSILLRSTDGIAWEKVSTIYEGGRNDETDIEFLPDGSLIATARLEYSFNVFGDRRGSTLIAVAFPPYDKWCKTHESRLTRLDGPCLFPYNGRVYAAGRYQPQLGEPFTRQGSVFARKRTSLFEVREDGLVYLTDLPSAGDTSYSGVVVQGDEAYICYYTSDPRRDYPWILGMFYPSRIFLVKVALSAKSNIENT